MVGGALLMSLCLLHRGVVWRNLCISRHGAKYATTRAAYHAPVVSGSVFKRRSQFCMSFITRQAGFGHGQRAACSKRGPRGAIENCYEALRLHWCA
eukprot:15016829-Alexandrium_andersonii.AAC.1